MKIVKVVPLLIISSFIIFSCGKSEPSKGFLKYEMKTAEKSEGNPAKPQDGYVSVKLAYPEITSATNEQVAYTLTNFVNITLLSDQFGQDMYRSPELYIEGFIKEYKNAQIKELYGKLVWKNERKIEVVYSDDKIMCFKFYQSNYLNGPDYVEGTYYTNYSLTKGDRLELKDVFQSNYEGKLTSLAEAKFRKAYKIEEGKDLNSAGFSFPQNAFLVSGNFCMNKEGIMFYYNPYVISNQPGKTYEVALTYKELEGIIRDEYIVK